VKSIKSKVDEQPDTTEKKRKRKHRSANNEEDDKDKRTIGKNPDGELYDPRQLKNKKKKSIRKS
jgi:hypothetical protein